MVDQQLTLSHPTNPTAFEGASRAAVPHLEEVFLGLRLEDNRLPSVPLSGRRSGERGVSGRGKCAAAVVPL